MAFSASAAPAARKPTPKNTPGIEDMNLADEKIVLALRLLIEGKSLRSTARITGVDINTLMKLLVRAGEKCEDLMGD
jgi:transposase-like protein